MTKRNMFRFVAAFLLSTLIIASASFAQSAGKDNSSSVKIRTSAYSAMCKNRIESKVTDLKGVLEAELKMDTKILSVKYDKKLVSSDDIIDSVRKMGYEAEIVNEKAESNNSRELKDSRS